MPANRAIAGFLDGSGSKVALGQQSILLTGATVTLAGQPVDAAAVHAGVQVQGKATSSGTNLQVRSLDLLPQLRGPVSSVNASAGTLVVLQRPVVVTARTQLEGQSSMGGMRSLSLADFRMGDSVLVFGAAQSSGHVLATRVERQGTASLQAEQLVQGTISGLDTTAMTFTLGATSVDYSLARVEGTLADGAQAIAEGSLAGSVLKASHVEVLESAASGGEGVELRGLVANLDTTAKSFDLAGFTVDYSQAALHGGTLANGAMAEVEGLPSPTRPTLVLASKVEVEEGPSGPAPSTGEAKGMVSALDAAAMTFSVGTQNFWADSATVLQREDSSITLADLKVGDWVEVLLDGTKLNAAGASYAVRVDAEETEDGDHELSGAISAFQPSAQTFMLGTFTVAVTPATLYEAEEGGPLAASVFWGTDRTGARVEAKGTLSGTTFTAGAIVLKEKQD